jgi:hypothetical protein
VLCDLCSFSIQIHLRYNCKREICQCFYQKHLLLLQWTIGIPQYQNPKPHNLVCDAQSLSHSLHLSFKHVQELSPNTKSNHTKSLGITKHRIILDRIVEASPVPITRHRGSSPVRSGSKDLCGENA